MPTDRIRLLKNIRSELPFGRRYTAVAGIYGPEQIEVNPLGAVSVKTAGGLLGVKPAEFEWIDENGLTEKDKAAAYDHLVAWLDNLAAVGVAGQFVAPSEIRAVLESNDAAIAECGKESHDAH